MTNQLMHFTRYFVFLILCIGLGDGRWKTNRRERENLQHDIGIFRKMADNIEHEIEDFYDDYPDEESLYTEYVTPLDNKASRQQSNEPKLETIHLFSQNESANTQKNNKFIPYRVDDLSKTKNFTPVSFKRTDITQNENISPDHPEWPKFEDMLLTIGKRYDWKNDRWVKVRGKTRDTKKQMKVANRRIEFLSKHKFYYRFVKLNRSKSKRNVILAVNAVR